MLSSLSYLDSKQLTQRGSQYKTAKGKRSKKSLELIHAGPVDIDVRNNILYRKQKDADSGNMSIAQQKVV